VIVRVNRRVVTPWPAQELEGAIRDHLVRVHVGRGARAALDHVDEEMLMMPAGANLLRCAHDQIRDAMIEQAEVSVRERRCFLHRREHEPLQRRLLDGGDDAIE